jgi:hypothetical protein
LQFLILAPPCVLVVGWAKAQALLSGAKALK